MKMMMYDDEYVKAVVAYIKKTSRNDYPHQGEMMVSSVLPILGFYETSEIRTNTD